MRRMLGALRQADETDVAAHASPAGNAAGASDGEADGTSGPAPPLPAPGLGHLDPPHSPPARGGVPVGVTRRGPPPDPPATHCHAAPPIAPGAPDTRAQHPRTSPRPAP